MDRQLNQYSSRVTQPKSQGASQAMLYATGLVEEDMHKPQVGIASMWFEGNPCNMHLLQLAEKVKEGLTAVGLVGMRFNTIGVSDGISMGTDGMSYSLQSRDLIADSIETVMAAQWYRDKDRITIDASKNSLTVALSEEEFSARRKNWTMPPSKADRGTLAKYIRLVKNAALGCVTDE